MRRRGNRVLLLAAYGLVGVLVTGACGVLGSSDASSAYDDVSDLADQSGAVPSMLHAANSAELGSIITDHEGYTLYRYDKDSTKPPKSNCDEQCAQMWSPVLAKGKTSVEGIDPNLVGTLMRTDATEQVTIAGWPLYRHKEDQQPGEAKGHGKGGTWFASTPNGAKAQATAASGSDGY